MVGLTIGLAAQERKTINEVAQADGSGENAGESADPPAALQLFIQRFLLLACYLIMFQRCRLYLKQFPHPDQ